MKSKLVLSISGIIFIMLPVLSFSQSSVSYEYDANGNRKSAVVELKKASEKDTSDTTLYSDEYVYKLESKDDLKDSPGYTMKAFPNPTLGQVHLTTNLEGKVSYRLYDMNGRKQLEGSMVKQTDIDLSNAKAGMYFLNLHARKEDIKKTIKILKK